jgi:uncharacterized protein (DUF433 family)
MILEPISSIAIPPLGCYNADEDESNLGGSMFGLERITADPEILGGKACIRGMRISVSLIVNLVANGMTVQEIIDEYPDLEPEDIRQALQYAAWAADDTIYMPTGAAA